MFGLQSSLPASGQLSPSLRLSFPCCEMRVIHHAGRKFKVIPKPTLGVFGLVFSCSVCRAYSWGVGLCLTPTWYNKDKGTVVINHGLDPLPRTEMLNQEVQVLPPSLPEGIPGHVRLSIRQFLALRYL